MPVQRCLLVFLGLALAPSYVSAQVRQVGGHIGVATSFATVSSSADPVSGKTTETISDRFPLVIPIGISVHTSENVVVDFETQVVLKLHPAGTTEFNVAPGIVYNFGPAAAGLRLVFPIGATPSAAGLVPPAEKIPPASSSTSSAPAHEGPRSFWPLSLSDIETFVSRTVGSEPRD